MSFVAMEQEVCAVCARPFDTGNILFDRRGKEETFKEKYQVTGWGLCPDHKEGIEKGLIYLVEVKNEAPTLEAADRTGQIAQLTKDAFLTIFTKEAMPPKGIAFVELGIIDQIKKMHEAAHERLDASKSPAKSKRKTTPKKGGKGKK